MTLLGELEGPFEDLMIYAWRRHLAAAAARTAALNAVPGAEDDAGSGRIGRLTVGFADMVAFNPDYVDIEIDQPQRVATESPVIDDYIRHTDSGSGRSQEETWDPTVGRPGEGA